MSIPTPSTDNLYKYMATLGVFLMIACIYSGAVVASNYHESYFKVMDIFYTETQEVKDTKDKERYRESLTNLITQETKNVNFCIKWLAYIFTFSSIMSVVGFFLWYFKVQQYEDAKIREKKE